MNYQRFMSNLSKEVRQQNKNRKRWQESDSPYTTAQQLVEESTELVKAIDQFDVTKNAEYAVISEIGDIFYLLLKISRDLGINLEEAARLKLIRNSLKYPDHLLSNGNGLDEAKAQARDLWESLGGDNAFYMWHAFSPLSPANIEDKPNGDHSE